MTGQAKHRAATIVGNIPFSFNEEEFRKLTHIDLSGPYAKAITDLLEDALATARPRALYKVCYIDNRTEDTVELEGIRFTSRVLSRNLSEVERVFPYIVTCGTPISQQKQLFQLLGDVESAVGVGLTDSFLMMPNKTVSGIFFPTEVNFVSCQLCTRENCPRRRTEYTGTIGLAGH